MTKNVQRMFRLDHRVVVVTGGAGFLGEMHAEAVCDSGGTTVLVDNDVSRLREVAQRLRQSGRAVAEVVADVTSYSDIKEAAAVILDRYGRIDGLVNNAAVNPTISQAGNFDGVRFEDFALERWKKELDVILTGSFLCCQIFGNIIAEHGGGAIINISSDLSEISPDNRLYWDENNPNTRSFKPISYSVAKTGLLGLTRYLSTYWAQKGVRVNTLSPGGVFQDQDSQFLKRVAERIPMARLADRHEYQGCLVFLLSDASSYVTGMNLVADGGRTVW